MKALKKILKIIFYFLGSLLLIIILLVLFLETNVGQNVLRKTVVSYLTDKLGTNVSIEEINTNLITYLEIKQVTIKDQSKNTLLHIGNIEARYKLLKLLNNQLSLSKLAIDTLDLHITRNENVKVFNFDFIIQAFTDSTVSQKSDTSGGGSMEFDVGAFSISQLHFLMEDNRAQQFYDISNNRIEVAINHLDPNKLLFDIDNIKSDGLVAIINQGIPKFVDKDEKKTGGAMPEIIVSKLALHNNSIALDLASAGVNDSSIIVDFLLEGISLNLNRNNLDVKQLVIDKNQSKVLIKAITEKPKVEAVEEAGKSANPFSFAIERIRLVNNDLKYDQDSAIINNSDQFNAQHLNLKQVQMDISNLNFNGAFINGLIKELSANEQCGITLEHLGVNFFYADTGISLNQLHLETTYSTIDGNLQVGYEKLDSVIKNPELLKINMELNPLNIGKKDLSYFNSYLKNNEQFKSLTTEDIFIQGSVNGKVSELNISKLRIKRDDVTVNLSGKMTGLPAIDQLNGVIKIEEVSGTSESILKLLPPSTIPENISIPENFLFKGTVSCNKGNYQPDLMMSSSYGDLNLKGSIFIPKNKTNDLVYNFNIQSTGFRLDLLLKDTLYGLTAFDIHANGRGVDPQNANMETSAFIPLIYFRGYTYKDIQLDAVLNSSVLDVNFITNDSACKIAGTASYSFDTLFPCLRTVANIEMIDLFRLGFITDSIQLKANVQADLSENSAKHINGTTDIRNIEIIKNQRRYLLDSIVLSAVNIDSSQSININAPFLDFKLDGNYELGTLTDAVKNLMIDHFAKNAVSSDSIPIVDAKIDGEVRYDSVFQVFLPGLTAMENVKYSGSIDTWRNELLIDINLPSAKYNELLIDSTTLFINTVSDNLKIGLTNYGIKNQSLSVNRSELTCNANKGVVNWNLDTYHSDDSLKYKLNGVFVIDTALITMSLGEEQLINYEKWKVNKDNIIKYFPGKGVLGNFELSSEGRKLSVFSSEASNGLPATLQLTDFPIGTFTKLVDSDTASFEGIINGKIILTGVNPFQFSTEMMIDSLNSFGIALGQLSIKADNDSGYNGNIKLKGTEMDFDLVAAYSDQKLLSGYLAVKTFDLSALRPLVKEYVTGMKGVLSGNLILKGTFDNPVLIGELNVKKTEGVYNEYGTYFSVPDETIHFNEQGMVFDKFNVYDSLSNTATIDGSLNTQNYRDYGFDLAIKTKHFQAINRKNNPDQQFYGPASFTTDINITSKSDIITIDGTIKVDDKSQINYELSGADTATESSNGVILYYNRNQTADSVVIDKMVTDNNRIAEGKKISIKVNFEITKASELHLLLNKANGDYLKVYGDANISLTQLPGGDLNLNGKYTIDHGEYLLAVSQFIRRKFEVTKGSTIDWSGAPTDANINLEALYRVEASIGPLMTSTQTLGNEGQRQRLPFELYLTLKEKILKPKISFRLDMAVKDQNAFSGSVYARIKQINSQESELNKQAMGLLILRQFIPMDPVASANSGFSMAVESTAKSTAGEIVSDQMNAMIASQVKAIDVSFILDARQDYSSGQKVDETDLTINMSKSLFNDRTTVKVGSTFALEGSDEHKHNTSGFAGDVSVEYKLTKNGRYRAKVYSLNQYDSAIDGMVVKTGTSFIIFLDFNRYRELFQKNRKP